MHSSCGWCSGTSAPTDCARTSPNTCVWVASSDQFELAAPVPFSVVCFRLRRETTDEAHQRVLDAVNGSGEVFLSHTKLDGRYVLRLAIGNERTTEPDVQRAWDVLRHVVQ